MSQQSENAFYFVPSWEMKEEARLAELLADLAVASVNELRG
jgi:hypothetical protein